MTSEMFLHGVDTTKYENVCSCRMYAKTKSTLWKK